MRGSLEDELDALFEGARAGDPLGYIFALVRVEGITSTRDPLRILEQVANQDPVPDQAEYCSLLKPAEALLALVENLARVARGEAFDPFPFRGMLPWAIHRKAEDQPRELAQIAAFVVARLKDLDKHELARGVEEAYPADIPDACGKRSRSVDHKATRVAWRRLLSAILNRYFAELATFKTQPALYKLPGFEVLELLSGEDGLCGFCLHFSSGGSARFERKPDSTDAVNLVPGVPMEFMVGDADALAEEWRIGDRLLHEIGLPGRYNDLGRWKPLVFPGDGDRVRAHVREMSDDPDVQGCLFYMHCTGHRVLEFVATMDAELPFTDMTAGGRVHIHKCNPSSDTEVRPAKFLYDGWVDLQDASAEAVEAALSDIARLMNRTSLAVDGPVVWRPKYSLRVHGGSFWIGDDMEELNAIFTAYPSGADEVAIDAAVDWYNRGAASGSPFTAFLCYYISIESLTDALFDGDATLGMEPLVERKRQPDEMRAQIETLYSDLFARNPVEFVRRAYFQVVIGQTQRLRLLIERVFGADSREYDLLFSKVDGRSLTDLRGQLAHGLASELSAAEARTIRERVSEVRQISRNLILRLLLGLGPEEPLPGSMRGVSASFSDPRNIEIASSLAGLPDQDWAIQPEWVSWQ